MISNSNFISLLWLCPNHFRWQFTKNLRPNPFSSTSNTLAGAHIHACADKIDCFYTHQNKNFIYNMLQLTTTMKATIPGTLCTIPFLLLTFLLLTLSTIPFILPDLCWNGANGWIEGAKKQLFFLRIFLLMCQSYKTQKLLKDTNDMLIFFLS